MEQFIPFHYDDLAVPINSDGTTINNYQQYIEWLAEYLNDNNFDLSPDQNMWIRGLRKKSPGFIVQILSDDLAMSELEREFIISDIRANVPYEEILIEQREQWEDSLTGEPDVDAPFEEICLTKEEFECIKREIAQLDSIDHLPGEVDIPVRGLLKIAINKCKSKQERIDIIRYFFDNYNEMASK